MSPLWTLAPVSLVLGALMMWVFRRTSNRQAIRETVNRIHAHLLEFWLFVDEPRLIWKSWKGLLVANARLYRLLLVPLLILTIFLAPVYACLDAFYGSSPLPVGKMALVTLGMHEPLEQLASIPQLNAPEGISVESPAVRIFSERQLSWRIRPLRPVSGVLDWPVMGTTVEKAVTAGDGIRYHSRKRVRSLVELIRFPLEPPLPAGPVEWIEISYPPATVALFGLEAHWAIWFALFSLLGAMLYPN
jgi:hypothetical protein